MDGMERLMERRRRVGKEVVGSQRGLEEELAEVRVRVEVGEAALGLAVLVTETGVKRNVVLLTVRVENAHPRAVQQRWQQWQAEVQQQVEVLVAAVVGLTVDGEQGRVVIVEEQQRVKKKKQQQQRDGWGGVLWTVGVAVSAAVADSAGRTGAVVGSVAWLVGMLPTHSPHHVLQLLTMGRSESGAAEQVRVWRTGMEWKA